MKITEGLEILSKAKSYTRLTRPEWPYFLSFNPMSLNLEISDHKMSLSIYTLSVFDFDYQDWKIVK